MESPQSWEAYFVDHGEALERGAWSSLAGAVAAAIAGREEREQALKRFARALWRGPSLLDPWRVECVLRQPPLCELRFGRSPLRACSLPALGALEPDLALRTLALARAALEALDRAEGAEGAARPERGSAREADRPASACPEALAAQDAGREVWWWLTGASPPEASGDAQARVRAAFAETVHHTLAHTGALGTASLEARRAVIDAWRRDAPRSAPDDAAAAFVREHDARAEWPRLAIEIVIDSIRNPSEGRLAAARAARLYDTLRAESLAGAPEGLAAWCQAAHAIGILGEAPFETDTLARRRDALARGLADTLGRALAATHARPDRPPLDFALWQALVVLARERASVEDWHALARLWLVAD
ncbi:MAG: hypothetical protein IT378_21780, partial [Sandaracinaceae bacterium]|nr:hypothetical protein [Sandaracinaceae bacterium]